MERFRVQHEPDSGVRARSDRRAGLEPIFIHETRTGNHCFRAEPRLNLIFSDGSGFNFSEKLGESGSGLSYLFRIETTLALIFQGLNVLKFSVPVLILPI